MPYGGVDEAHYAKQVAWTIPAFSSLSTVVGTFCTCKPFWFAGEELQLMIYPGGDRESARGFVSAFLRQCSSKFENRPRRRCTQFELGLKTADGCVVNLQELRVLPEQNGWRRGASRLFPRVELVRHLAPTDVLTLVCTLRQGDPMEVKSLASGRTSFTELEMLSKDFRDLLADQKWCDAILLVEGKEYRVHKCVLMARSPVFAAMFGHEMTEKETGTVVIPDCDEGSFGTFLEYLYSGRASDVSFSSALELYRTAHKYDVPQLRAFCARYLSRNLTAANVTSAAALADQYDEGQLMSVVQEFFNVHFGQIVVTAEWESFHRRYFHMANKLVVGASSYVSRLIEK